MNCPKCAQPMAEGAVVCPSCFEKTELCAVQQEVVCEQTAEETAVKNEKKKRGVRGVLIAAAVLLLIAAVIAAFVVPGLIG